MRTSGRPNVARASFAASRLRLPGRRLHQLAPRLWRHRLRQRLWDFGIGSLNFSSHDAGTAEELRAGCRRFPNPHGPGGDTKADEQLISCGTKLGSAFGSKVVATTRGFRHAPCVPQRETE